MSRPFGLRTSAISLESTQQTRWCITPRMAISSATCMPGSLCYSCNPSTSCGRGIHNLMSWQRSPLEHGLSFVFQLCGNSDAHHRMPTSSKLQEHTVPQPKLECEALYTANLAQKISSWHLALVPRLSLKKQKIHQVEGNSKKWTILEIT